MANIARLGVVLGLESAEFIKGIEKAKQSVGDFAKNTLPMLKNAATVGAAAFVGMTYKALQLSDQISDLASAADLSVASVLKISDAFQQSGGKYDEAGKSIQKFSETVDSAAKGSFELQTAFKSVGVTLEDLRTLSVEQLFYKSVDGASKLADSATRAGVKMDLFGKSMRGIDIANFNEQLKEGTGEFDSFAQSIKETADLADKLEKNARELVLIFIRELGPTLNRIFDIINKDGGLAAKAFGKIRESVLDLWYGVEKVILNLQKLEMILDQLPGGGKLGDFATEMNRLDEQLATLKDRVYGKGTITLPTITVTSNDKGKGGRNVKAGKDPEAEREKKIQEMIRVAKLNAEEFEREQQHASDMASIQQHMNSLTSNQRAIQESVNQVLDATSKKIQELTDKREEAIGKEGDPRLIAAYDEQIAKIQELGNAWAALAREQTTESIAAQQTFSYGWNQAFAQYAEDAENYAGMARDMFSVLTGSMSRAIDEFVENGKFSFKDFAGSIIKDLIKIELKMQAMQLFRMGIGAVMGAFSGGLGGASVIGSGTTEGGAGAIAFPVDMRANGGTVSANSPYLVGERGPELFVPGRSGAVIPNNTMGGMGGVTNITNNYIDAIDTKSFEDRIYGSSRAVWSANQFASKAISNNRART